MKKRKRRAVILFCERHFSESIRRGPSKLAIAVVVKHFLEICASARGAIEISIAFAKREVSVRLAGHGELPAAIERSGCSLLKAASPTLVRLARRSAKSDAGTRAHSKS